MGLNSWAGVGLKVTNRVAQRSTISSPVLHIKKRNLKGDSDMDLFIFAVWHKGDSYLHVVR